MHMYACCCCIDCYVYALLMLLTRGFASPSHVYGWTGYAWCEWRRLIGVCLCCMCCALVRCSGCGLCRGGLGPRVGLCLWGCGIVRRLLCPWLRMEPSGLLVPDGLDRIHGLVWGLSWA